MSFEIAKRIVSGRKAIAAAGASEQLVVADTECFEVDVCASTKNTSPVVVGASNVHASDAADAQLGTILLPGMNVKMHVDNVNKIWADAKVNGEVVCYTYYVHV